LPSSANTWSFKLIVDAFSLGIGAGKAVGSFREDNLLKESLSVVILRVVSILGSEPTLSSLLSSEEDKDKASGEGFLKTKKTEILLEEHLVM